MAGLSEFRLFVQSLTTFAPGNELVVCIPKTLQPPGTLQHLLLALHDVLKGLNARIEILESPAVAGVGDGWQRHVNFGQKWDGDEGFSQRAQLHKPAALQRALDIVPHKGALLIDSDCLLLRPWPPLPAAPQSWAVTTVDHRLMPHELHSWFRRVTGAAAALGDREAVLKFTNWSGFANTGLVWAASAESRLPARWLQAIINDGGTAYSDQGPLNSVLRAEAGGCRACDAAPRNATSAVRLGREWNLYPSFFSRSGWNRLVGVNTDGLLLVEDQPLVVAHLHLTAPSGYLSLRHQLCRLLRFDTAAAKIRHIGNQVAKEQERMGVADKYNRSPARKAAGSLLRGGAVSRNRRHRR
eukprot:TRINITY_DN6221_c0_g1_i7.p2 TRINITY_DN6221_c0_g1~~TRINITY_DN6221_c0_g1_i7.p2  ORF type:complete len:355 (+),score=83.22 TRINITY_DN6221_c0_g1_i7:926-1990(+)